MKHFTISSLVFLGACGGTQEPPSLPPPTVAEPSNTSTVASDPPPAASVAEPEDKAPTPTRDTSAAFAQKLYGALSAKEKGNFSLAASNVRDAMIAVGLGARDKTATEFATLLDADSAKLGADLTASAKGERAVWKSAMGEATLVNAARLWFDASQKPLPEFLAANEDAIGAQPEAVNFIDAAEAARGLINTWAREKTAGKIPELLSKGIVDSRTRLVATTAMYFKASWANGFSDALTTQEGFFIHGGKTAKKVPTLHRRGQYRGKVLGDFVAVELPYAKSDLAMLVAMPAGTTTLAALEERYVQKGIGALQEGLESGDTNLALPKFSFRSGGSIAPALRTLGLNDTFTDKANLSGIFGTNTVKLADVIHRTFIAVDEKGTEAAAATAAVVAVKSLPLGDPREIKLDRPFLFLIHDAAGHVLFAGRVADPSATP